MSSTFGIGTHVFDRAGREFVVRERPDGFRDEPDTVYVAHPQAECGCLPFYADDLSLTRPECFMKIIDDMKADPSVDRSYIDRLLAYKARFENSPHMLLL